MQDAFQPHRKGDTMDLHDFFQLSDDIERALYVFDHTSNHAVMRLYRRKEATDRMSLASEDAVPTILANGDNETVFLVYLYVSSVHSELHLTRCSALSSLCRNLPGNLSY